MLPQLLTTLQVKSRQSGRIYSTVLVVTRHQGDQYLVSMLEDTSEWVRDVRAAGGNALINRGRSRPVKLAEIPINERAPILKAWCQVATSGRQQLAVAHDAPISEFAAIAADHPVFRIDVID